MHKQIDRPRGPVLRTGSRYLSQLARSLITEVTTGRKPEGSSSIVGYTNRAAAVANWAFYWGFYKNIHNIRREPLPPSPSLRPSPSAAVEAMVEVGGADPSCRARVKVGRLATKNETP